MIPRLDEALREQPRVRLATLPTPLEKGPSLPGGARLLVKRDDLTGLGLGGNKARKLEFLCGDARAARADVLLTAGAGQSNHARMTAAAGAVLGIETHLVLGGEPDARPSGNRLLGLLFGARTQHPGTDRWNELERALDELAGDLAAGGRRPYRIPMGGSTPVGTLGFAAGWLELMNQCRSAGVRPTAVVHASSTGGTHAGLLAGRAIWEGAGLAAPEILAIGVAKQPGVDLAADARRLAVASLEQLGLPHGRVRADVDDGWIGPGYAIPTPAGDAAVRWAARHGAWVLDRTYTGKALAGLLDAAANGRFGPTDTVVFWHTGGHPAVFAPGGSKLTDVQQELEEVV